MSDIYDPLSVSDSQAEAEYTKQLAQQWLETSPEGKRFSRHYNTEQNRAKLAEVFNLLDEAITLENLSAAFEKLVASGAIQTEAEREAAKEETERQRAEANRLPWEQSCDAWIDNHSTLEIRERTSRDPAFRSYLKAANRIPELPTEYSPENLARQRKAQKIQKQRDSRFANVPAELFTFAEAYKHLPAKEALQRMRTEPMFKANVEKCVAAKIL